mmetsp:Transcript_10232/g.19338  ORF Transcript_10232/g.19338 Transcript_10232/m.19338 type:complete len:344 (-) Transcript_10232:105-1136(-)
MIQKMEEMVKPSSLLEAVRLGNDFMICAIEGIQKSGEARVRFPPCKRQVKLGVSNESRRVVHGRLAVARHARVANPQVSMQHRGLWIEPVQRPGRAGQHLLVVPGHGALLGLKALPRLMQSPLQSSLQKEICPVLVGRIVKRHNSQLGGCAEAVRARFATVHEHRGGVQTSHGPPELVLSRVLQHPKRAQVQALHDEVRSPVRQVARQKRLRAAHCVGGGNLPQTCSLPFEHASSIHFFVYLHKHVPLGAEHGVRLVQGSREMILSRLPCDVATAKVRQSAQHHQRALTILASIPSYCEIEPGSRTSISVDSLRYSSAVPQRSSPNLSTGFHRNCCSRARKRD